MPILDVNSLQLEDATDQVNTASLFSQTISPGEDMGEKLTFFRDLQHQTFRLSHQAGMHQIPLESTIIQTDNDETELVAPTATNLCATDILESSNKEEVIQLPMV